MFNKENYADVPQEMKELKRWVLWKKVTRDGKNTKLPIDAHNGKGAKSNDDTTWSTFQDACNGLEEYDCDGLGFMLGGGYFGVDIDHALDDKALIDEFVGALDSYTEISQSGQGIHIICKGVLPQGQRRKGNIEMYDNVRFFAMTGNIYEGHCQLHDRTQEIKALHEKYLQPSYTFQKESKEERRVTLLPNDEEVISKALSSKNNIIFSSLYYGQWEGAYTSQSDADLALCSFLAFWTNKDATQMDRIFRKSKLYRQKWDENRGEHTYGEITIQKAINGCQNAYDPKAMENTRAVSYNPETGEYVEAKKNYTYDDTGNAQRFVDEFGENIRYHYKNKCWMIYDGKTWVRDDKQQIKNLADKMIKEIKKEYFDELGKDDKKAEAILKNFKHLSSTSGKEAMLKEAMHIQSIATTNTDYDKKPYLLNCENGVVNLRTGELLPHDKRYMLSKNTHVNVGFNGKPKEWLKAINGIFQGNEGVLSFVKKAVGYSLTGDTKEQCFFQCYGNGANGKSVFLNTISNVLGDYALNAQVQSILAKGNSNNGGNASPDIARMCGARFVRTNEPNEGARFDEGLVKQLTGGDIVTARFLYGEEFQFKSEFKMWIACNYKIVVRGTDKGIWRRMRLIPFEAEFEGKNEDKSLESKIKAEYPQILAWAIQGCLQWQKEGLEMPDEIRIATNEYRDEMDIVRSFAKDRIKMKPGNKIKASLIYTAYKQWARDGNEYMMSNQKFGLEFAKKYTKKNVGGYIYYMDIDLKEADEAKYVFVKEK